jgi:hypothetical protein
MVAPSLEARFLLCSFLPGIPIFVIFYFCFPLKFEGIELVAVSGAFIFLFGILIDLLRHGIEDILEDILTLFPFGSNFYDVWKPFTSWEASNRNENYFNYLSTRHFGAYHMWEFTGNFLLSTLISLSIALLKRAPEMFQFSAVTYRIFGRGYDESFMKMFLSSLVIVSLLLLFLNPLVSLTWRKIILRCIHIRRDVNYLFCIFVFIWWGIVSYCVSKNYQLFIWSH